MGREDIFRLQNMQNPRFLLVGSYGKYSAEEFYDFTKKINQGSEAVVIDKERYLSIYSKVKKGRNLQFAIADGKEMPFQEGSFDLICTNHLLHQLVWGENKDTEDENLKVFLDQTYRILKENGMLLLDEQRYGHHKYELSTGEVQRSSFSGIVKKSQFGKCSKPFFVADYGYALRSEANTAKLNEDGSVSYGNKIILKDRNRLAVKLTKKE